MKKLMDKNEFADKLFEGKLSRRDALATLGAAGIVATTLPMTPGARAAGKHPVVFEWSGYELPEFHPGYIEKHGGSPEYGFFGEEEEALQKMRSGFAADISHPCTYSTRRWRDAGLLKPIDLSRINAWGDVFDSLKNLAGSVDANGDTYFMPWDWGNSSVIYRTDLIDQKYLEEESWEVLFDEQYAGRLGMFDSVDGVMGVVGLVIGAENPFNMNEDELKAAAELMRHQRDILRFYWTDQSSAEQAIASGELVASYAWNSAYLTLQEQGIPVAYMVPKEGIYTWVCGFVLINSGEGDEDMVYDYLNAVLAPEAGEYLMTAYGYGHSNAKTFDLVPQETQNKLGIKDPVSHMAGAKFFEEIAPEVRERYIEIFEDVKAGL
ncbi:MAG: hypothetical protein CMO26_23160 [Thiotrichales bacterium]|nr:hypothetical protein [Thiotrichales bacterium]